MINILNNIFFFFFLFQFQVMHATIYTNYEKYLTDPSQGFERKIDKMKHTELITLKTNILYFQDQNGTFHLNFSFQQYNNVIIPNSYTEIFIRINTKKMITPFDGLDQQIDLTILGLDNKQIWRSSFYFNKRQVYLNVLKTGNKQLDLVKFLSNRDMRQIQDIFIFNKEVYFYLEGFDGSYDFVIPNPVVEFYKKYFDYKNSIYKK